MRVLIVCIKQLCCLLSQLSSLSIEDQEDTQFPFAMRDLPPISQPGEQHQTPGHQAPVNHEAEGTATNGRLPSLPGTPPLPRSIPCYPAGSPIVPPRPNRARPDAEFQPMPLRRQLVSQVSMDCPLSPASRPRSPWGRFDPYDSPEVRFCVLLFIFMMGVSASYFMSLSIVMLSAFVMQFFLSVWSLKR